MSNIYVRSFNSKAIVGTHADARYRTYTGLLYLQHSN